MFKILLHLSTFTFGSSEEAISPKSMLNSHILNITVSIFTICIQMPEFLTTLVLKLEQVHFTTC